jgi:hypothetical protein
LSSLHPLKGWSLQLTRGGSTGQEFELFIGKIFRSLGHGVSLTPTTGDQGVDVLVKIEERLIAIQCKNLARPSGNRPVQEVYAGAKYYDASEAWVVAPAGYTEGARQLASRLEVELCTRTNIRGWIEQVNLSDSPESYMTYKEVYEALTIQSNEYLDLLIEVGRIRARAGQNTEVKQKFDQVREAIEDRLEEIQDKLEQALSKKAKLKNNDIGNQSRVRNMLALRQAEARQATAFLDLSIREDIPISDYVTNHNGLINISSEKPAERAVLRPRIVIDKDIDNEIIQGLCDRALNGHAANYPIEVNVEPQIQRVSTNYAEESTES